MTTTRLRTCLALYTTSVLKDDEDVFMNWPFINKLWFISLVSTLFNKSYGVAFLSVCYCNNLICIIIPIEEDILPCDAGNSLKFKITFTVLF